MSEEPGREVTFADGEIRTFILDQEGKQQPFTIPDTVSNRLFADWLQRHDRYTSAPPPDPPSNNRGG